MKSDIGRILIGFLCVCATAFASSDFHPEVNDELKVSFNWVSVDFKPGTTTTVSEFRFWYGAECKDVFPLLIDTNKMPQRHKAYEDARTLTEKTYQDIVKAAPKTLEDLKKIIGDTHVKSEYNRDPNGHWSDYIYQNFNFPWPLSNRWGVIRLRVDESNGPTLQEYRAEFKTAVGNFVTNEGFWELVPVQSQPGMCEWRGHYEADPGIPLPKIITKQGVKIGLKREVEENRALLKK